MKRHSLRADAVGHAKRLRRNPTDAERALWDGLREAMPGARFRRQVCFGPYFADFASHSAKLIVEVDGGHHSEVRDAARTEFLNGEGYKVIRFWNNDVLQNLDGVLQTIASQLPSPLVGEGGPKDRMRGAQRGCAPASGRHPHPSPPHKGEGGNDNLPVGVR